MSVVELRAALLKLDKERQRIDDEIRSTKAQLDGLGVGMNDPLVDKEGFPRADVDLYQVRSLRQRVTMLLNDSKEKQKEVEEHLAKLHALGPAALIPEKPSFPSSTSSSSTTSSRVAAAAPLSAPSVSSASPPEGMVFRPFALVDDVSEASPASRAGLMKGDRIAGIGTLVSLAPAVSASATSEGGLAGGAAPSAPSLSDLASVVRGNVGLALPLVVQRQRQDNSNSSSEGSFIQLSLTPQPWSGQGLLGCHVVPLPAV